MSVQFGSIASRAGVRVNDVIVAVGDKDVQTADEFHTAMKSVKPEQGVRLRLIREGTRLFFRAVNRERNTKANDVHSGTILLGDFKT